MELTNIRQQFDREGYVVVRDVIDAAALENGVIFFGCLVILSV